MATNTFPHYSIPFPNRLVDEQMPNLSDTEWRIVCVLVRQTLGWVEGVGGQRKKRDWLTHSQLRIRTGRESAAVSRAIQSLLAKQLILVEDSEGKTLLTPHQRQHNLGRLYFRLHPRLLADAKIEGENAKKESFVAKNENTKAKTTKETIYKNTPPSPSQEKQSPVQQFHALYQRRFQQHAPHNLLPPYSANKEGKLIESLLEQYSLETLCDLLEWFFALKDKWVREQGYSLVAFRHRLPKLLMSDTPAIKNTTRQAYHWSKVESLLPFDRNEIT